MRALRARLLASSSQCALVLACVLALPVNDAFAAQLHGRVVIGENGAAPGATVSVDGGAEVHADDASFFEINDVPAGQHRLTVHYVGLPEQTVEATASDMPTEVDVHLAALEEVMVSGYRASERKALQTKLADDKITEALFADDVGKLPDQNVAEAVKRLTGVSVANDQGEGRYVSIRGINPNLVNVTVNGQSAPVPEPEGRQIKLDDIPSAMIGSVQVTKTLTPDLDANAIAGQIDIGTLSAFERNKSFFANGRAYIGHYDLNDKSPIGGDVTAGGLFGTNEDFGAVLSFNYDRRPIRSENIQGSANWRTVGGQIVPDDIRMRIYNLVRERVGGVANFDWHASDAVKIHWRSTYSTFSDDENRDQLRIPIGTPVAATQTATTGTVTARGTRYDRRRIEKDKTFNTNLGGSLDVGSGTFDADVTYSRAEKKDPLRSEYQFQTANNAITATYDLSLDPYQITPNAAAYNSALYTAASTNYDTRLAVDEMYQVAVNYKMPIDIGSGSSVKVGAKYSKTDKTNNRDYQAYTLSGFTLASVDYEPAANTTFDGRFRLGPRISYTQAEDYLASHPTSKTLNVAGSLVNSLANDYIVDETVWSAYAMTTLKFDDLTIIPGVRMEHTEDDLTAKLFTATSSPTQGFNSFTTRSYTNVFPGVNARYDFSKEFVGRAAVTTSIGRPNFADLPPYISLDTGANTVTQGNPTLKPLKAINLDLAAEYYLPSQGVISIGGFYKHIDDPTYLAGSTQSGTFGGVAFTNALVTQPMNATDAYVLGVELNAQSQLTFLPSPFDGFGLGGNITFVHSSEKGLVGRAGSIPMPTQSDRTYSAQLYYEKYGFSARVAYSYRSAYLDTVGTGPSTDQFTDANGQWDAHMSYDVIQGVQVFVEGANLNDAPWRRYIGTRNQLVEVEHYGWSAKAGVQVKY